MIVRITLITFTLLEPKLDITTSNSVFSSAAGAAEAPAAATATLAAAETPNFSSISLINSTTSITLILEIASNISFFETAIIAPKF